MGTSRRRFFSDAREYCECCRTCTRKNEPIRKTIERNRIPEAMRALACTSFGWKFTAGSRVTRPEDRPYGQQHQQSGNRRHRSGERRPEQELREELRPSKPMLDQQEDRVEQPLAAEDERAVQGDVVGKERRLEPAGREPDDGHGKRARAECLGGERVGQQAECEARSEEHTSELQ